MTKEQRRACSILASMSMFVTIGVINWLGFDIVGVFYQAFFRKFGSSHD
jgi:hypothetical protein